MKKYMSMLVVRILVLIILILLILMIGEIILIFNNNDEWQKENALINKMNMDKLQNKSVADNPIWLHEDEVLKPKKDGIKRILIIGDSCIWGDGYSNANHIWWQQFKHLLKEKGYSDLEVLAAGVTGGYGTQQQLEFLKNEELINQINPDFIIIAYVANDPEFRDENYNLYEKVLNSDDIFTYSNNKVMNLVKNIYPNLYQKLSVLLSNKFYNNKQFTQHFGLSWNDWTQKISSGEWLEKYENEVIDPLSEYIDNELKVPYFFYITSTIDEISYNNIKYFFEEKDINYYYSYDLMQENNIVISSDLNDRKINPANWHQSVFDCKILADLLLTIMEENYADFLGDKIGIYEAELNINDWMPYSLKPNKISDNSYIITYPSVDSENAFLTLPVNKDYIKLNLEDPLQINNIKISGDDIEEIEIFINNINKELGYDTQEMVSLGIQNDEFVWKVDDTLEITSINISAKIKDGKSQDLTITIE